MIDRLRQLQGLLNTPMNQGGGLLGNLNQGALLGAALYGQGLKGKDPLAGAFPAVTQAAQLKKLTTPAKTELQKNLSQYLKSFDVISPISPTCPPDSP